MTLATQKQEVYDYVNTFLGGGMEKAQERMDREDAKNKVLTGL